MKKGKIRLFLFATAAMFALSVVLGFLSQNLLGGNAIFDFVIAAILSFLAFLFTLEIRSVCFEKHSPFWNGNFGLVRRLLEKYQDSTEDYLKIVKKILYVLIIAYAALLAKGILQFAVRGLVDTIK